MAFINVILWRFGKKPRLKRYNICNQRSTSSNLFYEFENLKMSILYLDKKQVLEQKINNLISDQIYFNRLYFFIT